MKITYYPEKDHLVITDDTGKSGGFCGPAAERVFMRLISQEIPVAIGHIAEKAKSAGRGESFSRN